MSLEDVFYFILTNQWCILFTHMNVKGQLTVQEDIEILTCSHCKPVSFIWPSRPYATQPPFSLQASVFRFTHYNQTSQSTPGTTHRRADPSHGCSPSVSMYVAVFIFTAVLCNKRWGDPSFIQSSLKLGKTKQLAKVISNYFLNEH